MLGSGALGTHAFAVGWKPASLGCLEAQGSQKRMDPYVACEVLCLFLEQGAGPNLQVCRNSALYLQSSCRSPSQECTGFPWGPRKCRFPGPRCRLQFKGSPR